MAINYKAVVSAIKWVGPFLPKVVETIRNNPEIWETVLRESRRLTGKQESGPEGVVKTLVVLREQVAYLESSADDVDEAHRARGWAKRLDHCEHAALLLRGAGSSRAELQMLQDRVAELRTEIFAAFIAEQGEDAAKAENG